MYKTVIETDSFIVDYDIAKGRIKVSYFDENYHYQDEISFYEKCVSCKYLTKSNGCSHPSGQQCTSDECLWWPDYKEVNKYEKNNC